MAEMINLPNGKIVTLDEFVTWSHQKQSANLRNGVVSDETRAKLSAAGMGREPPNKGKKGPPSPLKGVKRDPSPFKGKPASAAHKAKAYAAYWAKHVKQIMTPKGLFPSAKAAAVAYGMTSQGLRNRLKTHPAEYYYVETSE